MATTTTANLDLKDIQKQAQNLESAGATDLADMNSIDNMINLTWTTDKPSGNVEGAKVTAHPIPRIMVQGIERLLCATDPKFSVPAAINDPSKTDADEPIEKWCNALWYAAGRVQQKPIHIQAIPHMVRYGQSHIAVISTDDLVKQAQGRSKAAQMRAERAAARAPFLFRVLDPREGYIEQDETGLSAYYRKTTTTAGAIADEWGDAALAAGIKPNEVRTTSRILCEYWTDDIHAVWVDGSNMPLYLGEHGLPCIPISAVKIEDKPFLYTLLKSGLWNRLNLEMTVLYQLVAWFANNPMGIYRTNAEEPLRVRNDVPGGYIQIRKDEDYGPLARTVIDPSIMQSLDIGERLASEATMFKQSLGEPIGANTPFSAANLYHQAGRLPLVIIKQMGEMALGRVMEIALTLAKEKGATKVSTAMGSTMALKASDIPDGVLVTCTLETELPQDKRQNIQIAMQGIQAGLFSKRLGSEIVGEGQYKEMQVEIYKEKLLDLEHQKDVALAQADIQMQIQQKQMELQQQMQQAQQAQQQAQMQQAQAQQQPQQGQLPQGITPDMLQGGAPQGQGIPNPQDMQQQQPGMGPAEAQAGLPALPMTQGVPTEPQPGGQYGG